MFGLSLLVVFCVGLYLGHIISRPTNHSWPVVCVCRVRDRVGIVLRTDLNKASDAAWSACDNGIPTPMGSLRLDPPNVFVFRVDSLEYNLIVAGCYVEEAAFMVRGEIEVNIRTAYRHIHRKPFTGRNVNQA